ncbi:MAG: hypothetical protein ACP5VS_12110 [Desulfomonilaceae bacterium]
MNLCQPDSSKSCAACCGIYNVLDGRKEVLNDSILNRTRMFKNIPRDVDSLVAYAKKVKADFDLRPLDPEIHVCEYVGFTNDKFSTVGCMLHPYAQGNDGIDFRGLCYYGSVACKTFYCPATTDSDFRARQIVEKLVRDWHLYGLVATDVNYVSAFLSLIELSLGHKVDVKVILRPDIAAFFKRAIKWKESWPYGADSKTRRSCYYRKPEPLDQCEDTLITRMLDSLCFTFDIPHLPYVCASLIRKEVEAIVRVYQQVYIV